MTSHTPGPWKVLPPDEDDNYTKSRTIVEANAPKNESTRFRVANVYAWGSRKERDATAEFIVRAVNCHENLLEVCKDMLEYMPCYQGEQPCDSGLGTFVMAKKAIAKAEINPKEETQ